MGDLTANLSAYEFACQCHYPDCKSHKEVAHMPLVLAIQAAADHFKAKYFATQVQVDITCGNRCKAHDIDVQMHDAGKTRAQAEAMNSMHVSCIAADHRIKVMVGLHWQQITDIELYKYYDDKYFGSHGVGYYVGRTHLDTRSTKARWGLPATK